MQAAACVDNLPARASENPLNFWRGGLDNQAATKRPGQARCGGVSRNQRPSSAARRSGKIVGAAIVTNVVAAVYRRCDSAKSLLFDRPEEIAGIGVAVQSRPAHPRRIEAAIEGESRLLWRVIKCADNEIFAAVSAGPSREFFILERETLINFRPRDVGKSFVRDCERICDNDENDRAREFTLTCGFAAFSP